MKAEKQAFRIGARCAPALLAIAAVILPACATARGGSAGPEGSADESSFVSAPVDPRVGLAPGRSDAEQAAWNMDLIAHLPRPEGFSTNSDIAFQDDHLFMGNYNGFNIYDISNPRQPKLRVSVICPGNQGDLSVYGNLLFHSVQAESGRVDCGAEGVEDEVSAERFRGVRIFDISDITQPKQVAAVQTCRGSHTHSLVTDSDDPENVYIYVSGTSGPRPAAELEGCSGLPPDEDPNTSLFRIEVIQVPLDAPEEARVVSTPRIFADSATGNIAGLWQGGDHGAGTQTTSATLACHDITTYPEIGLAAGACSGNGILLDISDPANPVRIDEVMDPNFAYWHSATFNNDGTKVLFTDEWGGGSAPHCLASDPPNWGGDAIFGLEDRKLELQGYYKLPAPQTEFENCVAHNGSLVPVPGRDILVQAWYQGGISVVDFTDPTNPIEIAFFDRGPISVTDRATGGFWSAYWYNGHVYASGMVRGLDVFHLQPSEFLSQNEIDAANLVHYDEFNVQHQPRIEWPASFSVARAYMDQLARNDGLDPDRLEDISQFLDEAEEMSPSADRIDALLALATEIEADAADAADGARVRLLADAIRKLAAPGL